MARRIDTHTPNAIAGQPATPQACAADHRSPGEQNLAAGAARDQLAFTGMAARGDDPRAVDQDS